jgi:hypothetical protein
MYKKMGRRDEYRCLSILIPALYGNLLNRQLAEGFDES